MTIATHGGPLTVKHLEHCEPGELVRASFNESGQWAIIGHMDGQRVHSAVVISGSEGPFFVNAQSFHDLGSHPCLSYGKDYQIVPNHGGPCELSGPSHGKPSNKPGTLVYARALTSGAETERYLIAGGDHRATIIMDLQTFRVAAPDGGPGGNRADFNGWSIWMALPPRPDPPTKLFQYG
jgi:hypothetical protein